MAQIAELNVRIGAEIDALQKGIREAERALNRASRTLGAAAATLTQSITLPLAGIAAASIKMAGEMEGLKNAMRTTFETAGRSIQAADAELENLRKSAMAPGLDFEQAVRGSIRLQNVGMSAEGARRTIEELANAITMSGGTADNLNGVTVQLSQMIAKGKILNEDLRILKENMPALTRVLNDAFGTSTAEGLRELGVTGEEFVAKITEQMSKLPRVSGGISNSIVNAFAAMKNAAATFGETLNKTLGVSAMLDKFGNFVTGLAQKFAGLDDGTKRLIVGAGIFAAALAPVLFVSLKLASAFVGLTALVVQFRAASLAASFAGGGLVNTFLALNAATRANIIGAAVAVVGALAIAFSALSKDMSAAAQAARAVEEVNVAAAKSIADEKVAADLLIGTIRSETASREEKLAALKKLQNIAPQYFGKLTLEKTKTDELTKSYEAYTDALLRSAKAAAARDKMIENEKKLLELQSSTVADSGFMDRLGLSLRSGGDAAVMEKKFQKDKAEQIEALKVQNVEMAKIVTTNEAVAASTTKKTKATQIDTEALKDNKKAAEDLRKLQAESDLENAKSLLKNYDPNRKLSAQEAADFAGRRQTDTSFDTLPSALERTLPALEKIKVAVSEVKQATNGAFSTMILEAEKLSESFSKFGDIAVSAYTSALEAAKAGGITAAESHAAWVTGLKAVGRAALDAAADVVGAEIRKGVAASIAKTLATVPFPFNIALAAAGGAAAEALFKMAIARITVPKLAKGGLAYAPTMAMVGDNKNARVDPEVIAPLSKLRGMLGDAGGGFVATTRIEGGDLLVLVERAQMQRTRARGF